MADLHEQAASRSDLQIAPNFPVGKRDQMKQPKWVKDRDLVGLRRNGQSHLTFDWGEVADRGSSIFLAHYIEKYEFIWIPL